MAFDEAFRQLAMVRARGSEIQRRVDAAERLVAREEAKVCELEARLEGCQAIGGSQEEAELDSKS